MSGPFNEDDHGDFNCDGYPDHDETQLHAEESDDGIQFYCGRCGAEWFEEAEIDEGTGK